jgi:hypothetical protein
MPDHRRIRGAREQLDVTDDVRGPRARACTKNGSSSGTPGEVTTNIGALQQLRVEARRCA